MGSALGRALRATGSTVLWASDGRSAATARRADEAGLEDVASPAELAARAAVIFSVCPPHAAGDVLGSVAGFGGLYVDANAVAPATARDLAAKAPRFVDGGIVGPPPVDAGTTRLYLSGAEAAAVADL